MKRAFDKLVMGCVVTAASVALLSGGVKAPEGSSPVTASAVWQPGMRAISAVHAACANVPYPKFSECYFEQMAKAGAPPEAVRFSRRLALQHDGMLGFMRDFRSTGRVGIAYIFCPFRANENEVWLLVNGTPDLIDVDNLRAVPQNQLQQNPTYRAVASQHRKISLWPGDRGGTRYPLAEDLPNHGQRFVVSYYLLNGCHACARLGEAKFAFDFDRQGRLLGVKLVGVRALPAPSAGRPPAHL